MCATLLLSLALVTSDYRTTMFLADDEPKTVEVFFAVENVAAGLKAGATVNLLRLDGRTVTRTGKVSQTTSLLVPNAVVVSVNTVEKPKSPEQAIKVELQVKSNQVRIVERAKTQFVNVMETIPGGGTKVVKKPVTLLLESSK